MIIKSSKILQYGSSSYRRSAFNNGMPQISVLGFTLVELLVGLVISLFVVSVAITYLISSSRMLSNQTSEDYIQESARFAFEIMSSNIRLAGSNTSTSAQIEADGVFSRSVCGGGTGVECNANSIDYTVGTVSYDSDRLAVDYVSSAGRSCTGSTISKELRLVPVFYVDDVDDDGIASLYCQTYEAEFDPISLTFKDSDFVAVNPAVPLIDGVDSLQVQYGVDVDSNGTVDVYSSYDGFGSAGYSIDDVRAIRIGILVGSGQTISSEQKTLGNKSRTYNVLDGVFTKNDGVLRRVFTTTIFMPNTAS